MPDSARQSWQRFAIEKLGLDARVVSGLAARLLPMSAGPISSFITVWSLTKELQGLFYLFASLVALRSLFELGAGTSVIQVAAHARRHGVAAEASPLDPAFVATVNRWMLRVASIFGVVTAAGGSAFLIYQGHGDWQTLSSWLAYLGVSVFQFSSEGRWGLLEGADRMVIANRLRLRNALIQYGVQWAMLLMGAGLFSFVAASLAAYLSQELAFHRAHPWLYAKAPEQTAEKLAHFRTELVTLIKRASQTYLTGYFVFQIQQPICFHLLGADGSARLGFTQTIGMALIGLPTIWLAMNFPRLAHHVADRQFDEARSLFRSRYLQIVLLSLGAVAVAWTGTSVLRCFPRFADRLLDPLSTLVLYGSFAMQTISLAMTYWPRAFKVEPFVRIAYLQMFVTPLLLWFLASSWGLFGISLAFLSSWTLGFIGIFLITREYWPAGHLDRPPAAPADA